MKKSMVIVGAALVAGIGMQAAYTPFHYKETTKEFPHQSATGYFGPDTERGFGGIQKGDLKNIQKGDLKNWAFYGGGAAGVYGAYWLYNRYAVKPLQQALTALKEITKYKEAFLKAVENAQKQLTDKDKFIINDIIKTFDELKMKDGMGMSNLEGGIRYILQTPRQKK